MHAFERGGQERDVRDVGVCDFAVHGEGDRQPKGVAAAEAPRRQPRQALLGGGGAGVRAIDVTGPNTRSGPPRGSEDPPNLDYLTWADDFGIDLNLTVGISSAGMREPPG